jgi:hypothetical protein
MRRLGFKCSETGTDQAWLYVYGTLLECPWDSRTMLFPSISKTYRIFRSVSLFPIYKGATWPPFQRGMIMEGLRTQVLWRNAFSRKFSDFWPCGEMDEWTYGKDAKEETRCVDALLLLISVGPTATLVFRSLRTSLFCQQGTIGLEDSELFPSLFVVA